MHTKTVRRIANSLIEHGSVITRIEGYFYTANLEGNTVTLKPHGKGDIATSSMDVDDYGYTHGGRIYRAAIQATWDIATRIGEQRAAKDEVDQEHALIEFEWANGDRETIKVRASQLWIGGGIEYHCPECDQLVTNGCASGHMALSPIRRLD